MNINWKDDSSIVFFNPAMLGQDYVTYALEHQKEYPGLIWISTSGTTGKNKWVGLSRNAFLVSAKAVNEHLNVSSEDIWLHALPDFHVGGISIWARAYLSNSKVVDLKKDGVWKWNPNEFYQRLVDSKATLTSLVPAQVYDLLNLNLSAPDSLRAVIVGGDAISDALLEKGSSLNWPLLPSYGMTECASQVATAEIQSLGSRGGGLQAEDIKLQFDEGSLQPLSNLRLLKHVETKVENDGRLKIKSEALLTCYAHQTDKGLEFYNPKIDGWFITEDVGEISEGYLKVLGRFGSVLKVGGEKVNLFQLEQKLQNLIDGKGIQAILQATPDERLGSMISLVVEKASANPVTVEKLLEDFHKEVLPFEKIRFIRYVEKIARTPLGKPLR